MTKRLLFLGIMTALTLTVLVKGARTMVAQVQAHPSSVAHPAKPSNRAAMTAQPGLLPAATVIVYEVANAQYSGTVSANATDADCRALTFAITDDVHVTFASDGGMPEDFQVFYPGITLKFVGHTCIPAKGAEFTSHQHINFSGGFGLMNGRLSSGDKVTLGGVVTTSLDPGTAVVEFNASPNDPLVFEITKRGYMYVSGSGSVTLPSGKVYNFPPSQSSTDKPTAGAASSNSLTGCLVKSGDGYTIRNAKYPRGVEASLPKEFQDDAGYFVTLSGHWGVYPKSGEYGTISIGSGGQMTTTNVVHVFAVDGVASIGKACAPAAAKAAPSSVKIALSPRVTVSADVALGNLLEKTDPVYPPIAKAARVSGNVVLRAVISKGGMIEDLRVVSGPAMLQESALEAVRTWRYRPYLIDKKPVEVETTINVIFTLGG